MKRFQMPPNIATGLTMTVMEISMRMLAYLYLDQDGDGYGEDQTLIYACTQPSGYVLLGGDCDDLTTAANPHDEVAVTSLTTIVMAHRRKCRRRIGLVPRSGWRWLW